MPRGQYQRKTKFAEDLMPEQGPDRTIPAAGDARVLEHESKKPGFDPKITAIKKSRHIDGEIVVRHEMPSREQLEMLAYMDQEIEIIVNDSNDQNAEPVIYTGVNGRPQFFARGVAQKCKRKFAQALAGIQGRLEQNQVKDDKGNLSMVNRMKYSMRYPFVVIHDPQPIDPRGREWLKDLMSGQGGR